MITRTAVVDGLDHTFIMPIINQVREDVTKTLIHDPSAFIQNATMYEKNDSDVSDFIYDNPIGGNTLNVSYEIVQEDIERKGTSIYMPLNKIILLDRDNGFNIRPNYVPSTITITFKYVGQSKVLIQGMVTKLKTLYDDGGYLLSHNLGYSYLIPNVLLGLMDNVRTLKGLSGHVNDYVNAIAVDGIDTTIKVGTARETPVFRGTAINTFGYIETTPDEMTIERDGTAYSLEFNYKLTVKQPISLTVQYPILINNKQLDDVWLPANKLVKMVSKAETSIDVVGIINDYKSLKGTKIAMHKIPTYDNFCPTEFIKGDLKLPIISILLNVDQTNLKYLFSIDTLKYVGLQPFIIDYLKSRTGTELFILGNSIFLLNLYENNYPRDLGLTTTDTGDIVTTKDMDISKVYHIVISMILDKGLVNYYRDKFLNEEKIQQDDDLLAKLHLSIPRSSCMPVQLQY